MDFRPITAIDQIEECTKVLRASFNTVAIELGLTIENAPTNAAFITKELLAEYITRNPFLFGYYKNNAQIGCIAIEKSKNDAQTFFIERLAVLPEERHQGLGKKLLDFAIQKIQEYNGLIASIGIINENTILKNWYKAYGFLETGTKKFPHLPFTVCFMQKIVGTPFP